VEEEVKEEEEEEDENEDEVQGDKESQMKFVPIVDYVLVHGMTMREAGQ